MFRYIIFDKDHYVMMEITSPKDNEFTGFSIHPGDCYHDRHISSIFGNFICFEKMQISHVLCTVWLYDKTQLYGFLARLNKFYGDSPKRLDLIKLACKECGIEIKEN